MYLVQSRHKKILLFILYVAFFEDNYIFVGNLILHPGHNSLFLETVTIKFRGPRGRGTRKTNTHHKDIADNKQFWRTVKPLLSKSNEKITLVDDNKIISEDKDNAELLNLFFSNAVKNLKIPKFSDSNPLAENIPHPVFKGILQYKNHPSIIAIKNAINGPGFIFVE